MKWKYKLRKDSTNWHAWFAWHPVKLTNGDTIWLESILRKSTYRRFPSLVDRMFFVTDYEYEESILDILKDVK
jgi:hypothetical protein